MCEQNPHFRDDYRIAWITVLQAAKGSPSPHTVATYAVLGLHPEKVWPSIAARRRSVLGNEYSAWYDENGLMRPQISWVPPPKKPVQMEFLFHRAQAA